MNDSYKQAYERINVSTTRKPHFVCTTRLSYIENRGFVYMTDTLKERKSRISGKKSWDSGKTIGNVTFSGKIK